MGHATVPEKQEGGPAPSETATLLTRSNHNADGDQPSPASITDRADRNTADDWRPVPGFPGYECRPPNHVRSVDRMVETQRGPRHYRGVNLRIVGRSVWLYRPGEGRREGRSFCAAALVRQVFGDEVAA